MSTPHTKCERCGFIASDTRKLIQHLLDEASCPPTNSSLSHSDIIEQLNKIIELTCSICGREFSSKAGKSNHLRSCKGKLQNNNAQPSTSSCKKNTSNTTKNIKPKKISSASTSASTSVSKRKELFPFDKELTLLDCGYSAQDVLDFIVYKGESEGDGIGQMFINLHSKREHKNIKWYKDKYLVYVDDDGWIELNDELLCSHICMLFSIMEETWCDYEMSLRCETCEQLYDDETVARITKFMYEQIVDDNSVMFYCEDWLVKYLDNLKPK